MKKGQGDWGLGHGSEGRLEDPGLSSGQALFLIGGAAFSSLSISSNLMPLSHGLLPEQLKLLLHGADVGQQLGG